MKAVYFQKMHGIRSNWIVKPIVVLGQADFSRTASTFLSWSDDTYCSSLLFLRRYHHSCYSQTSRGFFFSWADPTCTFKLPFREKLISQIMHLKGFFFSWTDPTCTFKLFVFAKLISQIMHLKGFFLSWTDTIWVFKLRFCEKVISQILHLKGFFLSWAFDMCRFKFCFHAKAESQSLHW